ncbi:hypothetical protein GF361_04880 [Candidatus Woesearchaeota archaeon]|nr:hypothetical protein [Candidatus Woesearchaeota archaeon]
MIKMLQKISLSKKDKAKGLKIPKKINQDLAYLIGVFAGDGSLGYRPNKYEYSLKCVGNPKDEKEFYNKIIKQKFTKVFGFSPDIKLFDKETTFGFRVFSKALITYLTKIIGLPLGSKYKTLKIPNKIFANNNLIIQFVKGVIDTDGSISFKKKYKKYPYYPVISFSSKSKNFTKEIANWLKNQDFKIVEKYDYKIIDFRTKQGYTIINRIELNGNQNLIKWMNKIGFSSPKHIKKIKKYWKK